ncbi:hypothetical protein NW762_014622 [Fusarium torreyae]|uniref:BD-FAE-like domain-containing protein n=1 Tax=Fusarium torreyae TaxID=1237075 RepID=A0A9W8RL77_9HYPO|nr:hypothetical protein NW762_014622 [Fusarium torreyae]
MRDDKIGEKTNAHLSAPDPDWEVVARSRAQVEEKLDALFQLPVEQFRQVVYVPPPLPADAPVPGQDITIHESHVTVRDGSSIRLRIYKPMNSTERNALFLNIHGGGWTTGQPETEEWQNRLIAFRNQIIVVSADYRLYDQTTP